MLYRPCRRSGQRGGRRRASRGRGRRVAQRLHPHALSRERTIGLGVINDTFETAITWDRFETFHDRVKAATERAIVDATGRAGQVTCRFTHVYPDGPAPYFTFHAAGRHGQLITQWKTIKSAALDAVIDGGGTVTHHHSVGRDHRRWYDRQRPPLFAAALAAAKARSTRRRCSIRGTDRSVEVLRTSIGRCVGAPLSRCCARRR